MDRKIGNIELLMTSKQLKNEEQKESITKMMVNGLEDIAQINRCQTINIDQEIIGTSMAHEMSYWLVIKKKAQFYSKTFDQNLGESSRVFTTKMSKYNY